MQTYSMSDLEAQTGYSARGVRHLTAKGLLPKTKYGGNQTRYSVEVLLRLLAIKKMRVEQKVQLAQIKTALRNITLEQLAAFVGVWPAGVARPVAAPAPTLTEAALGPPERWLRVPLAPGLELMVRDGDARVEQLAASMRTAFAALHAAK